MPQLEDGNETYVQVNMMSLKKMNQTPTEEVEEKENIILESKK
ncbi:hypothetical protein [Prevotella sp.]